MLAQIKIWVSDLKPILPSMFYEKRQQISPVGHKWHLLLGTYRHTYKIIEYFLPLIQNVTLFNCKKKPKKNIVLLISLLQLTQNFMFHKKITKWSKITKNSKGIFCYENKKNTFDFSSQKSKKKNCFSWTFPMSSQVSINP